MPDMTINLGQIRVFEAVTRTGSFAQAAERLGVTPPAVSLQIRQLEEAYGVRLFERLRKRVRLTSVGEELAPYAQRIVALAGDAERALEATRSFAGGRLRIVASATAAAYYLPPLLTRVRQRYPDIRVHLDVANSQRVRERIATLEGDVGVLGVETAHPDLVFERLAEDPLVVVVAPGHPWGRRRRVALAELASQPLILREPGSASRQLVERRLHRVGARADPSMEIASNEVIKRAVEMGNGVSLMSAAIVRREVDAGQLRALTVSDDRLVRTIHLVYHRERQDSPMIHAIRQVARSLRREGRRAPREARRVRSG
ncbi:MAG TPA: LysR substrate-binding domain-containing protein [Candidatus Methylomirabilis sp.]|nr:LysR substrate-binding domain-containing protein [Candidatus Methylomirabilis sp.]